MRTEADWLRILIECGVHLTTAGKWAPVFAEQITAGTFSAGDSELDDFLGQILKESARLEKAEENLSYSATRMAQVWPGRYARVDDFGQKMKDAAGLFVPNDRALELHRNPEALANATYGGRLGNVEPGDGWKYRGRGLMQVTGRDNYRVVGETLGIDLLAAPDLMAQPETALRASIAWWEGNVPDGVMGDIRKVTKRVNGADLGLGERETLTLAAQKAIGDASA